MRKKIFWSFKSHINRRQQNIETQHLPWRSPQGRITYVQFCPRNVQPHRCALRQRQNNRSNQRDFEVCIQPAHSAYADWYPEWHGAFGTRKSADNAIWPQKQPPVYYHSGTLKKCSFSCVSIRNAPTLARRRAARWRSRCARKRGKKKVIWFLWFMCIFVGSL